jgi:hypothetical protein
MDTGLDGLCAYAAATTDLPCRASDALQASKLLPKTENVGLPATINACVVAVVLFRDGGFRRRELNAPYFIENQALNTAARAYISRIAITRFRLHLARGPAQI